MRAGCSRVGARARAIGAAAATIVAVAAGAGGFPGAAPPPARGAEPCAVPTGLSVRQVGPGAVRLLWRLPARLRGESVRVWRSGEVVGQTRRRSMVVRVRPGRRVTLGAGIVAPHGSAPRCRATVKTVARSPSGIGRLPAPVGLAGRRLSAGRVELTWRVVPGARAYRVLRDGSVLRQTRARRLRVTLAAKRTYLFSVAAVDVQGRPGRLSRAVSLRLGHRAPSAPSRPQLAAASESSLQVTWRRVARESAPVRAYRVLRDGVVVGQVTQPSISLTRLFPDRTYRIQVAAIDSQGYMSELSPPLWARTQVPAPSAGGVRLFVLASTDSSFAAFQAHYRQVSTIYPTYYDCDTTSGATVGRDDPLITRWAMARGVAVQPRYNCQTPAMVHQLVSDPLRRQLLINDLAGLVDRYGYDGINLDLEKGAPGDRDGLSALVEGLAAALHARGARLSVDVSPKVRDVPNHPRSTFFDYVALARHADEVIVMSWGLHWTTSGPGPLIDIRWYTSVYDYVSSLPNRGRFVLGAPNYGLDWPAGGGPSHPATALDWGALQALLARTGAQPVFDAASGEWHFGYTDAVGVPHEVWFSDAASLDTHLALAAPRGLAGVALWRSGQEDPALWETPTVRAATR